MGSGKEGGSNGAVASSSKKMIQNLKEIVNCPEAEIYAMLKECNMDPNEAVNRLLSQDPFHEVKSKREKKKESKDVGESRSRSVSSTYNRGGRSGADRYPSSRNVAQYGGSDSSASRGKTAYKKENGLTAYTSSATSMAGSNVNRGQRPLSEASTERTASYYAPPETIVAPLSSDFQPAWSGMPGQVSMADIVKMGRPQGKASSTLSTSQHVNNQPYLGSSTPYTPHDLNPSQNYATKVLEMNTGWSEHVPLNDDWTLEEEPPAASVSAIPEPTIESEPYGDPHNRTNEQYRSQSDEVPFEEDADGNAHSSFVRSVPHSNQIMVEDNPGSASEYENDKYHNDSSYQANCQGVEETNASVQSVTSNFQSLSLPKEDVDASSEEDGPAVKIPDHLQVQSSECSHLSFGSFGSGMSAPISGSIGSRVLQSSEEAAVHADAPSVGHSEAQNTEFYEEDHLRTAPDVNTTHRIGSSSSNFETPSVSQVDMLKQETPEVGQDNEYTSPSSTVNYAFENGQQLNPSFANSHTSSQIQGLPSLSGVMPYSDALPNTLVASNVQPLREAELAYSPFLVSQSMASKYSNSVSSINGPAASMAEALKTGNLSASQTSQTLPGGSNISGGAVLPQHLAVHPYSQPSVPMGHFPTANMMGYPFLPQSYTYMPSAFQQAYAASNSTYPQSLAAALLPQYKNSASMSSLPQAGAVASGYSAFGNSNSIPNNFVANPPSAPAGTSMNYDDILSSHYKDASHLLSLQQGAGSRTLSGVPGNTYYNSFPGQNQQPAGFRQNQQPSQHYGPLSGYPNYYHSQSGLLLDHQQQMSRDDSLGGPQGQPPKQNQQMWQNSY